MAEEIKYFTLNTGAKIPSVGLGTWQSEPGVVGDAIITAVKAGFRHIDCARIYRNEEEVGLALKKLFEDGTVTREDLFITSKIWCTDLAPEDVHGALDSTLNDLQLDYVDLYLIHWPFRVNKGENFSGESIVPIDIPSTWSEMEKLYDEGKARAIGVSNFTSKTLGNVLTVARVPPAVNQVECHPVWPQTKLRAFCEAHGVHLSVMLLVSYGVLIARKSAGLFPSYYVLRGGLESNFSLLQGFSPLGSPGTSFVSGSVLENPIVKLVAEKLGKTPAQVALRWGLQMGNSVLPKSTKEARIKENLDVFDWSIPEDLFAKLSEIEHMRLIRGEFLVHENGLFKSVEELWDGDI